MYFHYQKIYFLDQSIQTIFSLILKQKHWYASAISVQPMFRLVTPTLVVVSCDLHKFKRFAHVLGMYALLDGVLCFISLIRDVQRDCLNINWSYGNVQRILM